MEGDAWILCSASHSSTQFGLKYVGNQSLFCSSHEDVAGKCLLLLWTDSSGIHLEKKRAFFWMWLRIWVEVLFLFLKVLCFIHSHVMFSHGLRVALSVLRGRFIANHWPSPAVPSQRSGHIYTFICPSMLYTAKYNAHWGLQMMSYVMKEAGTPLLLYEADNRPAVFSQISVWGTWTVNKCLAYIYKWDVDTSSHMTFVFVFLNYLLLALQLSPYQQRHVTVLHQVVVQSPLTTVNGFQLEPNNLYL